MDSFREDALYLALDKLADVDAIPGADLDQCLVPLRVELGANVFAIKAHAGALGFASKRQVFSCSACSLRAASPRGDALRPLARSPTVEVASPTALPISAKVIPAACSSRIRSAHLLMAASLRLSVIQTQRHSVTVFRFNSAMTIGERIRTWRKKRGMKVPELAKKAHLAPTTLYDLERGDSDSTTKLHLIAAALQINVHWLETGRGEPESDVASTSGEGDGWPFKFDRSRYDDLEPQQRAIIESAVLAMVDQMEAPRSIKKKKAL